MFSILGERRREAQYAAWRVCYTRTVGKAETKPLWRPMVQVMGALRGNGLSRNAKFPEAGSCSACANEKAVLCIRGREVCWPCVNQMKQIDILSGRDRGK